MNKKLIIVLVLSLILLNISISARDRFLINADLKNLSISDSTYKEIYSSSVIIPEFKVGYFIIKDIYIWGGLGFFSKEGKTPDLGEIAKSSQTFLSFGAGYRGFFTRKFEFTAGIGLSSIKYKEEALGEEVSGSPMGFRLDGSLFYKFNKSIFINFSLGYINGSDDIEDISIKLGGFNTGLGIGVLF